MRDVQCAVIRGRQNPNASSKQSRADKRGVAPRIAGKAEAEADMTYIHTPGTRYRLCKYNNSFLFLLVSLCHTIYRKLLVNTLNDGTSIDKKCPILLSASALALR